MIFTSDPAQHQTGRALLISRFVEHKSKAAAVLNRTLIDAVLGGSRQSLFCWEHGRDMSFSGYDCEVGMLEGKCVVVAVYRKVNPKRCEGPGLGHWELLLLAVPKDIGRRGYGTAMVEHVKQKSAAAGAKLVIISNGAPFWRRPKLRLEEITPVVKKRLKSAGGPLVPWSNGAPSQGRETPILLLSPAAPAPAAPAPAAAAPAAPAPAAAAPAAAAPAAAAPAAAAPAAAAPAAPPRAPPLSDKEVEDAPTNQGAYRCCSAVSDAIRTAERALPLPQQQRSSRGTCTHHRSCLARAPTRLPPRLPPPSVPRRRRDSRRQPSSLATRHRLVPCKPCRCLSATPQLRLRRRPRSRPHRHPRQRQQQP